MILWQLFLVFFRIGLFAIGGAYSFLPLIQNDVVTRYGWLTREEFLEILGLAKILPGALSIKFATYVGHKTAGAWGVAVANLANLLAPVVFILIAALCYQLIKPLPQVKQVFAAIQIAVFAMVLAVAFESIQISDFFLLRNLGIAIIAFVLFFVFHIHPVFILLGSGIVGFFMK